MNERLRAVIPTKDEILPLLGSFAIALIAKLPLSAINTAGTILVLERMKENPSVTHLALLAYAAYSIGYTSLDYLILNRDRVAASAKANTLYRGLSFLLPHHHRFNAAAAQVGTVLMNIVGINPDLSALISSAVTVATGDFRFALAQRTSDAAVSLVTQAPYAVGLYLRKRKPRNL